MKKIGDYNSSNGTNIKAKRRQADQSFYHSSLWRNTRAKYMAEKRAEHEEIILDVYLDNIEKNDPEILARFMECDKPLSEIALKDGVLKIANTCDHIRPINAGGDKTDFDNLQMVTATEHYHKTKEENQINE